MKKEVFIDGHECEDVIEDQQKFLKIMKDYAPYIVNFQANRSIEEKKYPADYMVDEFN